MWPFAFGPEARLRRKTSINVRKRPIQARSQETVAAILAATSRVLVREGYEAATTTRVAEVAGVSIGSLYQYFPSKEALVAALIDEHIAKLLGLLAHAVDAAATLPMEAALRALIRTLLLAHAVNPELHAVLTGHFAWVGGFDKVRALNAEAERMVLAYLEAHRREVRRADLRLVAFVLVHSVQSVVNASCSDGGCRARSTRSPAS